MTPDSRLPAPAPTTPETGGAKEKRANRLRRQFRFGRFKGATILERAGRWETLTSEVFAEACYEALGHNLTRGQVADLEHLVRSTAPDLSDRAHLISFGNKVWDMRRLTWSDQPAEDCVYRVSYETGNGADRERIPFILDLACGDEGVYDDIMQSVAPIIMDKKPTGVIWYLGNGANGKSTLVHLLYLIFGPYLTEITVKQLEDERDTPQLNGKLGNICKESSEGFIEDTRTYKSIGTHESFSVHKFHSQDMVTIEGNVHHIFSANNIPTFGDKSYGARRRTLVVPFQNRFKPDEMFEERTFTQAFIVRFIEEMIHYARQLKRQNYEYRFSSTTRAIKEKYDTDANTAQTYAEELKSQDIVGFANYRLLYTDYENWCSDHGYKPSSINVLRRCMDELGYARRSMRLSAGRTIKVYLMPDVEATDQNLVNVTGRTGLKQLSDSKFVNKVDVIEGDKKNELLKEW